MARKPASRSEFIYFDVEHEDGSRRSNRRVPAELVLGHDKDAAAKAVVEAQDQEIAERSGQPPLAIKRFVRSKGKQFRCQ